MLVKKSPKDKERDGINHLQRIEEKDPRRQIKDGFLGKEGQVEEAKGTHPAVFAAPTARPFADPRSTPRPRCRRRRRWDPGPGRPRPHFR